MKLKNYFLMVLMMSLSLIGFSQTLDQSYAPSSTGGNTFSVSSSQNVGQSFTAGITGDLSQVNLRLIDFSFAPSTTFVAGDFQLRIFEGNGYSGTLLNTTVINITSVSSGFTEQVIPLSSLIPIVSGNQYTIDFRGIGTSVVGIDAVNPNYFGGDFYFDNGSNAFATVNDLWFKTFVNVAVPATHLNFDGSNDVINSGSNLTTSFTGKTAFTIEAWVKPETTTGIGVIVGNYDYPSAGLGMQMLLRKENSNYVLWMDNGTGFINITQPNTVVLNTWQHIAGTWDGSVLSLYIDGVLVNSSNVSGALPSINSTFSIGSNGHNEAFNGAIDEVRIWDVTRTVSQINSSKNCELQGNESGLVSYFKFNQGLDQANNGSETALSNSVSGVVDGTLLNFALTGASSNWLAGSPVTSGSTIPGIPTVTTPIAYNQNDTATGLTATTGTNGTGLLWYTTATGGMGATTAPTPSTTTVGNTSYWVSSTNANGCESERVEIVVTVIAPLPATHLNFDGSNDVINSGSNLTTSFTGKTAFTLEAWVKPETTTGIGVIVGNYDYPSAGLGMQMLLRKENSNYVLWMDNGTGFINITQPNTVVLNTWQHIAGTWDGSILSLYIDGVLVNSSNVSGALPSINSTFSIGSNGHNEAFNGAIDDVRIWDVTRTVSQINSSKNCELQGNESGLVSYFKFNQGLDQANNTSETALSNSVSGVVDGTLLNFALTGASSNWLAGSPVTSGSTIPGVPTVSTPIVYNQNDAATALTATTGTNGTGLLWYTTATGGTGTATAPTPSTTTVGNTSYWVSSTNANGCESERVEIVVTVNALSPATHLNFDGSTNTVSLNAPLVVNGEFTLETWIKTSTDGIIFSYFVINDYFVGLTLDAGKLNYLEVDGNSSDAYQLIGSQDLRDNIWHHVAYTRDSNGFSNLYVDGALEATTTAVSTLITVSFDEIGSAGGSSSFNGDLDELRVWNIARTANQISSARSCELQGNESGLVSYFKFNQGLNQANNASETTLLNSVSGAVNGTLTNFTLTGATSNWLAGSPVTSGSIIPGVPTVTTPVTYNQNDTATALTATTGTNGTGLLWYTVATGGTGTTTAPTPSTTTVGNTSYWVSSTNANGCESERVEIVVTVNVVIPDAPTTTYATQVYTGDDKTLAALDVTGTIITWYDAQTAGTVLPNTTLLVDEATYYASQTVSGTESTERIAIMVNRISDDTQTLVTGSTVANLVATPSTGTTERWFTSVTGGTELGNATALTSGTYYVEQFSTETTETIATGFSNPNGVAVQSDGKILVADPNNNSIKRMDADGSNLEVLGSGFNQPYGVAVQTDGKILVADTGNSVIKRMDADGSNIESLGTGFNSPFGVALQSDGKILVADTFNNAIKRMDADGGNIETLGSGFNAPSDVSVQSDGKILVSDTNNNTIKRMGADGSNIVSLGSGISAPRGVSVQSDGKVIVVDTGNSAIKRMDADGSNIVSLGSGINSPRGVSVQSDGKILVVDNSSNAVKRIVLATQSNRVPVNVSVVLPEAPTTTYATQVYTGDDKTLATLEVTGTNITWYDAQTAGTVLPNTTLLVDEATYYASQTVSATESTARVAITVNRISDDTQTLVTGSTVANLVATPSTGTTERWFTSVTGGTELGNATALTSGTYYVEQFSTEMVNPLGNGFSSISGIAIQADGKILVADGSSIKRMNSDGTGTQVLSSGFSAPKGLAVEPNGSILVADNGEGLKRISSDGSSIVTLNSFNTNNSDPVYIDTALNVAIEPNGNILVFDSLDSKIKRLDTNGMYIETVATGINVFDLEVEASGKIWVANGGSIKRMNSDGTNIVSLANSFSGIESLTVGTDGKILFTSNNATSKDVLRMNTDGTNIEILANGFGFLFDVGAQSNIEILLAEATSVKRLSLTTLSNRVPVNVSVVLPEAPTTTYATQVYTGDDKTLATLEVTGTNITWYDAQTAGTVLPNTTLLVDEAMYYASQTVSSTESTERVAITVNRISDNMQAFTAGNTVASLVATPSTNTTAQWFTTATGGTVLDNSTPLANGTYYVEQFSAESTISLANYNSFIPGLAVQPDGKILYGDDGSVKRMDSDGSNIEVLATFSNTLRLALEFNGDILVTSGSGEIRRISADATTVTQLPYSGSTPYDIAVEADGKILVMDSGLDRIVRMDTDGSNQTNIISGINPNGSRDIEVESDGKILYVDGNSIKRANSDGSIIATLGSGYIEIGGLTVLPDNKILFAHYLGASGSQIIRMDADGTNIEILNTSFFQPTDLAIDSNSNILVADTNSISRFSLETLSNRVPVTLTETLSTNNFDTSDFKLYPNPTVNNVSITFSQLDKVAIQVYDLRGRILISKKEVESNETISLSTLSTGVYLFKIKTSKGEIIKRIIKK